jgi:uncharacterized protein (TIGR02996 family)
MSDEGFLRTILAEPSDRVSRLVYADWLEEHGDNTRAEFLRLLAEPGPTAEGTDQRRARRKRLQQLAKGLDTGWIAAVSGLKIAVVQASFRVANGSRVSFADPLEVSLDCCVCCRCWRTVIFQPDGDEGKCTPTGHPFPGYWLGKEESHEGPVVSACYRVAFRYEPFTDAKYPERQPKVRPTWARIGFEIVCPHCGHANQCSTQNNIVRPWTWHCQCGEVLYTERDEMPMLSLVGMSPGNSPQVRRGIEPPTGSL